MEEEEIPPQKWDPPLEGAVGGEENSTPPASPRVEEQVSEQPVEEEDDEVKVYPKGGAPKYPSDGLSHSSSHEDGKKSGKARKVRIVG